MDIDRECTDKKPRVLTVKRYVIFYEAVMVTKVMVVDDSAFVRKILTEILSKDRGINVIGAAADPIFAMRHMRRQWPDVIVLDIVMPRMDGIVFLKQLMSERPTPVVMCSAYTEKGAEATIRALAAGAVNFVTKPRLSLREKFPSAAGSVLHAVKEAAQARVINLTDNRPIESKFPTEVDPKLSADAILSRPGGWAVRSTERIAVIGASTGGTHALENVLAALPPSSPGLAIVQHMPAKFTEAFAARLNVVCRIEVREAVNGDRIVPGKALIAPGGKHMLVKRAFGAYYVEIVEGPPVCRHCPSVDVLFRSAAKYAGKNALGILMTGMGDDGARGLKELFDCGAQTVIQDEASCVVYGMPKEALKLGAAGTVLSLSDISPEIMKYALKERPRGEA